MPEKEFKLPSVSPLIGSTMPVFRQTIRGQEIDGQFKKVLRNSRAVVSLLTPFRAYERQFIDPRAQNVEPSNLVFIVGHWRSGTTFLHNLMCKAHNASFISTYQTVFPNCMGSQPIIKPFMRLVMPNRRPADNVRLDADLPQEEEFAFSNVNPFTYYRFMYFPKDYSRIYDEAIHFEGLDAVQKEQFAADYRLLLNKAFLYRPGEVMIVKNPVHTARVGWLHKQFPGAKFIHIHRNPYEVFGSTFRFFSRLIPTLWFHKVDSAFIRHMIYDVYQRVYSDFDRDMAQNNDLVMVDVRYESLLESPMSELQRIYSELELPGFEGSKPAFLEYCNRRKSHKVQDYEYSPQERSEIEHHLGDFISRWKYS